MDSRGRYQPSERAAHLLTRVIYRREYLNACASFHSVGVWKKNEKGREQRDEKRRGERQSFVRVLFFRHF